MSVFVTRARVSVAKTTDTPIVTVGDTVLEAGHLRVPDGPGLGVTPRFEALGQPALARRVVPQVVAGKMLVAISMSEPDAGTALTDLRTTARLDGDHIVIDGAKRWCSGAGHSEGYVVFCRFDGVQGAKGVGAVFVDRDAPGLTFGQQEELMGFRGVPSADMNFDGVRVPRDQLLVGPGGFASLMGLFNIERLGNATMALGVAAGALEQVTTYVQERKQFGKPIFDPPLDRHFWWMGLVGMGLGMIVAVISLVLALNGWPASRMWFYYLLSALVFLVGLQFLISWILMRVLEEISRRDSLAAEDLDGGQAR